MTIVTTVPNRNGVLEILPSRNIWFDAEQYEVRLLEMVALGSTFRT